MKRLKSHKALINHLKKKIIESEQKKKELTEYIKKLHEKYSKKEISYSFYIETLYKKFEGKNVQEWTEHFEDYIKECKRKIKRERGVLTAKHISILIISVVTIISILKYILAKTSLI